MNSGLMPDQILVDLGDNYKALAQEMKNCYMKEPEGHITHQIIPVEEVLSHLVEFARIRMTENYIRRTIEKIYGLRFNDHGSRLATIASLIVADLWTVFSTMKFCDELDDILPYHYRMMHGSTTIVLQFVPRNPSQERQACLRFDHEVSAMSQVETRACLF